MTIKEKVVEKLKEQEEEFILVLIKKNQKNLYGKNIKVKLK